MALSNDVVERLSPLKNEFDEVLMKEDFSLRWKSRSNLIKKGD